MATERLIIKNFGPIREAELDLRKVTVLIGEQASGKSVLAKLAAICQEFDTLLLCSKYSGRTEEKPYTTFIGFLEYYGLKEFGEINSKIQFRSSDYTVDWDSNDLEIEIYEANLSRLIEKISEVALSDTRQQRGSRNELEHLGLEMIESITKVEYIPAERIFVSISDCGDGDAHYIDNFSIKFQDRRKQKPNFLLLIGNIRYTFDEKQRGNEILLERDTTVEYSQASTGVQSLAPLQVIIETVTPILKTVFIIEEPELNLYPTTQKKLVEYLVEKCTKGDNRLIITTHSPYILTALNNCIEANNVLKSNPEAKAEVDKLVPPESQISYEDVAAYFVANGTAKSIMNEEYQMIDANALDDVSEELARVYDSLLDLKYQPQD